MLHLAPIGATKKGRPKIARSPGRIVLPDNAAIFGLPCNRCRPLISGALPFTVATDAIIAFFCRLPNYGADNTS